MKISMLNVKMTILLTLALVIVSCGDKVVKEAPPKVLKLGNQMDITLKAQKKATLSVKIDRAVNKNESLYITAQSPYNDPFEQPIVQVKSDKGFQLLCHQEASDYMGICQIENSELRKWRVFSIELYCEVDCQLKVSAYISAVYSVNLGDSNWLSNYQNTALVLGFEVEIPSDQNFTEFLILAQPTSSQDILEGTSLFANYGKDPKLPTNSDYSVKSQSVSQHRIGIFLSSSQVKPGDLVRFLVVVAPHVELTLKTSIVNQDTYQLYIGSPVYDFTTPDQKRIYILDLEQYETEKATFEQTISLKFISYSGNPTITVSMDPQFNDSKILQKWRGDASHSYQITPQRRKEVGDGKKIYVNVEAFWSTNFQLEASVNKKPFIDLEAQITELFHIEPKKMKNLIFVDENYASDLPKDGLVEYKMSVQVSKDSVSFRIRNCGSYKQGNALDCMIENEADLKKDDVVKSFSEIKFAQSPTSGNHILIFKYNVSRSCQSSGDTNATKKYSCKFHILITNDISEAENVNVEFTVNKDTIKQWLREGHMEKGTVMQGAWNYYAFELPSTQDIIRLQFYATVIQGDVTLLVSRNKNYPSFDDYSDSDNDLLYSMWNSVILDEEDIKEGYYYIGVFGNSMTDYSLGVALERMKKTNNTSENETDQSIGNYTSDDQTEVTQIWLQKGLVQTVNMPVGKSVSKFVFSPQVDKQNSVVKIIQMQGHIDYIIQDKEDDKKICDSKILQESGDDQCQFQSILGHSYVITITAGDEDEVQVFTVSYSTDQVCSLYPWNFPLQVVINPNDTACLTYKMYQLEDIHISLSLSPLQLLTLKLGMQIKFGNKVLKIDEHEKKISKKQLIILCKQKAESSCSFTITLKYTSKNADDKAASFLMAVETYRGQNVLFENIASKVSTDQISTKLANKFFYYIFQDNKNKDMDIFVDSETASKYQIAARIVTNAQFVRDTNSSLYPKFNDDSVFVVNTSDNSAMTVLSITSDQFMNNTADNSELSVVLISVYGIPPKSNKKPIYIYNIEVNQGTETLVLGDSQIGTISKDVVYEYEVDLFDVESSAIQVRSLSDDDCVDAYVYNPFESKDPTQFTDMVTFNGELGVRVILIKTTAESCSYQISFNSLDLPIQNAMTSIPYEIALQEEKIKYFLYKHTSANSFRVVQMVTAGSSYLYVQGIKPKDNMQSLIKKQLSEYSFSSDMNGDLQISKKSRDFCPSCYYLIAVQGHPSVNAEITINPADVPILLNELAPLRDRLEPNQSNSYQFYARNNFVVSASVLYGKIDITVKDYQAKQVTKAENIQNAEDLQIEVTKVEETSNYFDERTKYVIQVKAASNSSYYIHIKKGKQGIVRAYEGLPLNLQLEKDVKQQIQFYSIHKAGIVNLLVEDLKYYELESENKISFEAKKDSTDMINNVAKSENSYNVQLKALEGKYLIQITSTMNTEVALVFARKEFNHLQVARSYFMDKPSIFEIYSPGDSVMIQIYSCQSDVEVRASPNFTLLMTQTQNEDGNGIVRMEHENYGGHYVVVADSLKGEYFLETSPLGNERNEISYLISYHLFNKEKGEKMPYHSFGSSSEQIQYKYYLGGVQFMLSRVKRKDSNPISANVTYKLYISNNSAQISKMTKCALGQVYTSTLTVDVDTTGTPFFKFETNKIKEIVGSSETYLVGAEATVTLSENEATHQRQINFVYEVVQLSINTEIVYKGESKLEKIQYIALWIIIPFVFGAILLYFAARYFIRSYQGYSTQLVEEDEHAHRGQSEQAIIQSI